MGVDKKKAAAYESARAELTAALTMNNAIASALQACEEPEIKESLKAAGLKSNALLFLSLTTYNRVADVFLDDVQNEVKVEMNKRKKAREAGRVPSKPTK